MSDQAQPSATNASLVRRARAAGAEEATQPLDVEPQLASRPDRLAEGRWLFERKLDGIRLLVHVHDGTVRLQSRNRRPYATRLPALARAVGRAATTDLIADGELVALDGDVTSFTLLQHRLGAASGASAAVAADVHLYLFDLLHVAGHDVRPLPLTTRKELLSSAIHFERSVRYTDHLEGEHVRAKDLLGEACRRGWEGLVAKRPDSPYRPRRSTAWCKLPCLRSDDVVVVGFTRPEGARTGFGALLLGYHDPAGRLRYAGKVGTGFDHDHLTTLGAFLERIESPSAPVVEPPAGRGTRWVRPVVVVRIVHAGWTTAGRLRHPRFDRVVADRPPEEVVHDPGSGGAA